MLGKEAPSREVSVSPSFFFFGFERVFSVREKQKERVLSSFRELIFSSARDCFRIDKKKCLNLGEFAGSTFGATKSKCLNAKQKHKNEVFF